MQIHGDADELPSIIGLFFTFVFGAVMLGYTILKFEILVNRTEADMMSTVREAYYDSDFVIDASQNLNIAVAFTAYDNERESELDPSIAELIIHYRSWKLDEKSGKVKNEIGRLN